MAANCCAMQSGNLPARTDLCRAFCQNDDHVSPLNCHPRTKRCFGGIRLLHDTATYLSWSGYLRGDMWMAYDANSGGLAARIPAPSLKGYTVVNPRSA